MLASRTGTIPVELGVALPHFRVVGLETPELCVVRAPSGVTIHLGESHPSGERDVTAQGLFFLVSPEEHPGRHLRILAKLAGLVEQPDFLPTLLELDATTDVRRLLRGEAVREIVGQLASQLEAAKSPQLWQSRAPGEFENVLAVSRSGRDTAVVDRAAHVASMAGGRVDAVQLLANQMVPWNAETADGAGGKPWIDVIRTVVRGGHDLVVIGPDAGRGGVDSFTQHLMRKCPCPVWALRAGSRPRCTKILAAIAAHPADMGHRGTDESILRIASKLAAHDNAELHVVHAWRLPGENLAYVRGLPSAELAELANTWRRTAGRALADALRERGLALPAAQVHLVEGQAGDVVQRLAEERDMDLIVIGTAGRSGIPGFFIGNTAEELVQSVRCSVLAVKPPGFVTPVR